MNPLMRIPLLRDLLLFGYRTVLGLRHLSTTIGAVLRWLFNSRETTNYTYPLTPANLQYLACFIADITGKTQAEVTGYINELEQDDELRAHISKLTANSDESYKADRQIYYGKRLGWYAFVRILRPKVIIETGVDKGLGACVLTAALRRNAAEGFEGQYYGTDINPRAGYLLTAPYTQHGRILYGDSIESLNDFAQPIDLFINDSDHSAEYEALEYEAIASKMSANGLILGDNCEVTTKLFAFAEATNRRFLFFREEPAKHWFVGGGIGVAQKRG